MKIAIITWFSNLNYGTALQCFALQKYLKDKYACEVEIINYSPLNSDYIKPSSQKFDHFIYKAVNKIKKSIYDDSVEYDRLLNSQFSTELSQKKKAFDNFLKNIVFTKNITENKDFSSLENQFDLFICGSDQIWNPTILNGRFYLDFVTKKPKIAYAVSFGISYLPKYSHNYITNFIADFKAIGLRESTCLDELRKITDNKNISVVCDPTFLLDADLWKSFKSDRIKDNRYIVTYFLGDTKISKKALNIFNEKFKTDNVILPSTKYMLEKANSKNVEYGPAEFLDLISNAEFVLTDSFHAVCFSLIFEKNFCVLPKHSKENPFKQNSRIESLLKISGLSERFVQNENEIKEILNTPINYQQVKTKLNQYILNSKEFLDKNINWS